MKYILVIFLLAFSINGNAQSEPFEASYATESFVIIMSTKSYAAAKMMAVEASKKLNLKLDLRDLKPNKEGGLTHTRAICEGQGWDYPCYVSRGRELQGEWVTIDYSNAFKGFTKGYYIVTTAGAEPSLIKTALKKVQKVYKNAYAKQTEVYIGCMH